MCGQGHTARPPALLLRGLVEPSPRIVILGLLVAVLFHLPLLPTGLSGWLRLFFRSQPAALQSGPQQSVVVPIELDMFEETPPAGPEKGSEAASAETPQNAAKKPNGLQAMLEPPSAASARASKKKRAAATQASAEVKKPKKTKKPKAKKPKKPKKPKAKKPKQSKPKPSATASPKRPSERPPKVAPAKAAASGDASPAAAAPIADPFSVAGKAGKVRSKKPNVKIYISAKRLRKRRLLASQFGKLLLAIPQWNELLGGTRLDPMAHFDEVLLSAPQLRDARWLVAIIGYNIPSKRMKGAVDAVVQRSGSGGRWLDGYPVPVAAIGKKGERRVVLVPKSRLLAVLPQSAEDQIPNVLKLGSFPAGQDVIVIDLIAPHRAFQGTAAFSIPKSMSRMRVRLRLAPGDGFRVDLELRDASPKDAAKHARELAREIEAIRQVPLTGLFKAKYFIGKPRLWAKESTVYASATISAAQAKRLITWVDALLLTP